MKNAKPTPQQEQHTDLLRRTLHFARGPGARFEVQYFPDYVEVRDLDEYKGRTYHIKTAYNPTAYKALCDLHAAVCVRIEEFYNFPLC